MPRTTGTATLRPFLSRRASSGESAQVCGLSIVAESGVGQPFGWAARLAGSFAGRAVHVTASATATITRPITVAALSSCQHLRIESFQLEALR